MAEKAEVVEAAGTDVAPASSVIGKGIAKRADDKALAAFLTAANDAAPIDPAAAQEDIIRRILAADTADAVLEQQAAIHARDVLGQILKVVGYSFNESDFGETGPSFYMLMDCVTDDGEPFKVTCGAINVMAQLYRLQQLEAFPLDARIVETARATKAGYKPMWLEAVAPAF